ncbi:hypothetical protein BKA93DRAFT_475308 [Sparassis latifolia]
MQTRTSCLRPVVRFAGRFEPPRWANGRVLIVGELTSFVLVRALPLPCPTSSQRRGHSSRAGCRLVATTFVYRTVSRSRDLSECNVRNEGRELTMGALARAPPLIPAKSLTRVQHPSRIRWPLEARRSGCRTIYNMRLEVDEGDGRKSRSGKRARWESRLIAAGGHSDRELGRIPSSGGG